MSTDKITKFMEENFQNALPVNMVRVTVNFEANELFQDLAEMYVMEAERVTRYSSNMQVAISVEEYLQYFKTLLFLRISRVNGVQNATVMGYRNDMRNYLIPAFVNILLISIGKATDVNYGFEFVPQTSIEITELLSPEQMRNISQRLRTLNLSGLVCVETGIAMSPAGELAFMATMNIQGEILGYKKDHAVYGFYASLFNHTIISEILEPRMLRIRYGARDDYRHLLNQLFG